MGVFEELSGEKQKLLKKHLDLVIKANEKVNFTRIDTREEGMVLHIEDSLSALREMEEAPLGLYGDMGSGPGYPGIPLAVATGRKTMLIDARKRKMDVMQDIIEELGLSSQISTYSGRAELLARKEPRTFAVITARALAKLPVLMELASPLLQRRGWLICYKAQLSEDELDHAMRVQLLTGMHLLSDRNVYIGDDITRRILVFEKKGNPSVKLPRQEGAAKKKPLDV